MISLALHVAMWVVVAFLAIWLLTSSIVIIRGNEIGIVELKYFGKPLPEDRVIAMKWQVGVQAQTMGPGLHLLIPRSLQRLLPMNF